MMIDDPAGPFANQSISTQSFSELFMFTSVYGQITACAVATSCCISDVPSQWEGQNFDPPPLLPHFSTDFNESQNQERYLGYDPTGKIWLMWDDGKALEGGLRREGIFCYFLWSIFFCILAHAYRSHQKTDHDHLWLKMRVST